MNESMQLKLAKLTLQDIESIIKGGLELETGVARLAGIENAIARYNYYKQYPARIPDYLKEDQHDTRTTTGNE